MTSIMNIPATYAIYFDHDCGVWDLYIDCDLYWYYSTQEDAEQAAREHYMNASNNQGNEMNDLYVVLVQDDGLQCLCFDIFGREVFVGSLSQAQNLQAEMVAEYPHITYTIFKLTEV